jgi:hypothetical protein
VTYMAVEDDFYDHTKVVDLFNGPCPADAVALWTLAGSWSSARLTDGFVPSARVPMFQLDKRAAAELVRVRLWLEVKGGYQFHEWNSRNPTKSAVVAKRKKTAERVGKLRQKRMGNAHGNAVTDSVTPGVSNAATVGEVRVPPVPCPLSPTSKDVCAGEAPAGTAPRSGFGRFHEQFWIVFARWFERARGNFPIRTGHSKDAALAIWTQATEDGIDPEQYAEALCDHYWRQDWPNDPANKPTVRNFYDQLDRLVPALREDWAEFIQPKAVAAE